MEHEQPAWYPEAYITIQVRVPDDLRHDETVKADIALAAQEYANETYGRHERPGHE